MYPRFKSWIEDNMVEMEKKITTTTTPTTPAATTSRAFTMSCDILLLVLIRASLN